MLLLVTLPGQGHELVPHNPIYSGIELSMFGCVAREERRPAQRRKRGCKPRHIRLSSCPTLGEHTTDMSYQRRQPAVSRVSTQTPTAATPFPGLHQPALAEIRRNRRPAGKNLHISVSNVDHDWSAREHARKAVSIRRLRC